MVISLGDLCILNLIALVAFPLIEFWFSPKEERGLNVYIAFWLVAICSGVVWAVVAFAETLGWLTWV